MLPLLISGRRSVRGERGMMDMMAVLEYMGAILAVAAFYLISDNHNKYLSHGLNVFSLSMLIAWAALSQNYGPIIVWGCLTLISLKKLIEKSPEQS